MNEFNCIPVPTRETGPKKRQTDRQTLRHTPLGEISAGGHHKVGLVLFNNKHFFLLILIF